ncbi:MAG: hypothetical protein CL868_19455 [Cytophagaceae bacterium]|nr:hypothetical protein [Cytophagaceae bacterium]|tara:strand:+ start:12 stop:425 length:414 start_codon:yes stop_codon:yes gene_type:complete
MAVIKLFQKKIIYPVVAVLLLLLVFLYYSYNPSGAGFFPRCPFYSLTGLYCPGCGSQRAMHSLLHLDFATALSYNPLFIAGLVIFIYNLSIKVLHYFGLKAKNFLYSKQTPYIILVVVVSFWILRNVDYEPFNYLAP